MALLVNMMELSWGLLGSIKLHFLHLVIETAMHISNALLQYQQGAIICLFGSDVVHWSEF